MVTIDWVKRIVGSIGSLGNLVWTNLLQSQRRIHHSVENVGARCEGEGDSEAVYLVGGSVLSLWFVEPNKRDRPKKPDGPAPRHAPRNGSCISSVVLISQYSCLGDYNLLDTHPAFV